MCLKYFVGHSTCDHHEYLGSHHCSLRPCDLDTQHFFYIVDDFPVPWPEGLRAEGGALACEICATRQRDKFDPNEVSVQAYPPTNYFQVKEIQPTGYTLPINVVKVEEDDMAVQSTIESKDSDDIFDYDYKSLSDVDDEEWNVQNNRRQNTRHDQARDEVLGQRHGEYLQSQLEHLPNNLMQQRQSLPFVQPRLTPEANATGYHDQYPMPYMGYLAPLPVLSIPTWHGGMVSLPSVPTKPASTRPDDSSLQLLPAFIPKDADKQTALPQLPATPPPTPPFIVGSITDAYLRIEAAKRRYMRERVRRQRSSLQDSLPARKMALTDFMVKKRTQRGQHKEVGAPEDMGVNAWSSLPFADEWSDTECGAEERAGLQGMRNGHVGLPADWSH